MQDKQITRLTDRQSAIFSFTIFLTAEAGRTGSCSRTGCWKWELESTYVRGRDEGIEYQVHLCTLDTPIPLFFVSLESYQSSI